MKFNLKIFDPDPNIIADLKEELGDLPSITMHLVDKMLYLEPPGGIDVLYLPLAAAERFGAKPLIHESRIFATSPEDRQAGLPGFVISGTCLAPADPRGPIPEMRILLSAVFDAIRTFNGREEVQLQRVGFWAYNLLSGLTPTELRRILLEVVPELRSEGTETKDVS